MPTQATALLLLTAALVRASGSGLRAASKGRLRRGAGWLLVASAAWFAAGATGAWFPVWPLLLIGLVAGFADWREPSFGRWLAGDLVLVGCACVFAIPPVTFGRTALAAIAFASVGFGADLACRRLRLQVRRFVSATSLAALMGLAIVLFLAGARPWPVRQWPRFYELISLHAGLTSTELPGTRRVDLVSGAVAWLNRPAGRGPFPGALFFHGANADGSSQPSAIVARRALLDAGFTVLAVDHPGFGRSLPPSADAPLEAWDPLPTVLAAFNELDTRDEVDDIIAVGHSMGVADALRLLAAEAALETCFLFGGSFPEPASRDEYWARRFHRDRRMAPGSIPVERTVEIRRRYYSNEVRANALPPSHPLVVFGAFEFEYENIRATRDALFEALPGRAERWVVKDSNHYFSASDKWGLLLGDTRVSRRLSRRFRAARSRRNR